MKKHPSNEILIGRRDLEDIEYLTILEDVSWNGNANKWILKLQFDLDYIPDSSELKKTVWYVQLDDNYPKGKISFFPAAKGGISLTYPHQSYNDYIEGQLWRIGDLCLDTQVKVINRGVNPSELNTEEGRLYWHCFRALNWIKAAYEKNLFCTGDYFELPVFPVSNCNRNELVAFNENDKTFSRWNLSKSTYGYVEFIRIKNSARVLLVKRMNTYNGYMRRKVTWGSIADNAVKEDGLWILLNNIPIISEWQVPRTFKELKEVCIGQGIDIINVIKVFAKNHRDGRRYMLLIGFPIPNKVGGQNIQISWQAIKLPMFSYEQLSFKGYSYSKPKIRKVKKGDLIYWIQDLKKIFYSNMKIEWILTENWNEETLLSRGRAVKELRKLNILLIGCGALGSNIAENLARAGVLKLTLMDGERLVAGNLTRHTLTLNEILKSKAEMIAERVSFCSPIVKAESICTKLNADSISNINLNQYDLIIECTGSNLLIELLEDYNFNNNKIIISASISRGAKRLYLYSSEAKAFNVNDFFNKLKPFAEKDLVDFKDNPLPREGIGCWHPVFPAKANEVAIMASISINYIEEIIHNDVFMNNFRVYETIYNNGIFSGVNIIETERENVYK